MNENDALLCLAAKAIGYELKLNQSGSHQLFKDGKYSSFWNPLNDDGDALRLAVKLGIGVKYYRNAPPELGLPRECAFASIKVGEWIAEAAVNGDKNAATRRAIVRAAAAIGEAMA